MPQPPRPTPKPPSLHESRGGSALLSIGDVIWHLPVPPGVSAFAKGGSIDVPGFHAVCAAGGLFFDDVWVYFCFTINRDAPA